MLSSARKQLATGGPHRIRHTLAPIVFSCYNLIRRFASQERPDDDLYQKKMQKIFQFCRSTIVAMCKEAQMTEIPLKLFLQGAIVCDLVEGFANKETVCYEFMSQALSIYEDEISDSRAQLAAITLIMATLQKITVFTNENHEPLRNQCALAASKLFKKPDQCRGVCSVAHLFWSGQVAESETAMHDGKHVVECLKKAIKISSQCMDPSVQVQLFTEVLNHYVYFFEIGCGEITVALLNQLIGKIRETIPQLEDTSETQQIRNHFQSTLHHLRDQSERPPENASFNYAGLVI